MLLLIFWVLLCYWVSYGFVIYICDASMFWLWRILYLWQLIHVNFCKRWKFPLRSNTFFMNFKKPQLPGNLRRVSLNCYSHNQGLLLTCRRYLMIPTNILNPVHTAKVPSKTRRSVNDDNPRRPRLVNEHACFLAINVFFYLFIHSILTFPRFHHFRKLFGHQKANTGAIPMKI